MQVVPSEVRASSKASIKTHAKRSAQDAEGLSKKAAALRGPTGGPVRERMGKAGATTAQSATELGKQVAVKPFAGPTTQAEFWAKASRYKNPQVLAEAIILAKPKRSVAEKTFIRNLLAPVLHQIGTLMTEHKGGYIGLPELDLDGGIKARDTSSYRSMGVLEAEREIIRAQRDIKTEDAAFQAAVKAYDEAPNAKRKETWAAVEVTSAARSQALEAAQRKRLGDFYQVYKDTPGRPFNEIERMRPQLTIDGPRSEPEPRVYPDHVPYEYQQIVKLAETGQFHLDTLMHIVEDPSLVAMSYAHIKYMRQGYHPQHRDVQERMPVFMHLDGWSYAAQALGTALARTYEAMTEGPEAKAYAAQFPKKASIGSTTTATLDILRKVLPRKAD